MMASSFRFIEEPASRETIWQQALSVVGAYRGGGWSVAARLMRRRGIAHALAFEDDFLRERFRPVV